MPSVSEKQRRFMGAELSRERAGKRTKTGMSDKQLSEFASSNPGSQANKDPRGAHGGYEMKKSFPESKPAPRGAAPAGRVPPLSGPRRNASPKRNPSKLAASGAPATAMYGGPPAEGFHRPSVSRSTAVPAQHKKYEHLGRFSTGKPRAGVSKNTVTPSQANC
jgi:hypothetical protein